MVATVETFKRRHYFRGAPFGINQFLWERGAQWDADEKAWPAGSSRPSGERRQEPVDVAPEFCARTAAMQIERVAQVAERTAAQVEKTSRQAGILFAPLLMLICATAVPVALAWWKVSAPVIAAALLLPIGMLCIIAVIVQAAARRGELFLFGTQKVILTAIQQGALGSREHLLTTDQPPAKALEEVRPVLEQIKPEMGRPHLQGKTRTYGGES